MQFTDYKPGEYITVLTGQETFCDAGCHVNEAYSNLKGVPMKVLAVDWPYIFADPLGGKSATVVDARLAEFTRCSPDYVAAIEKVCCPVAMPPPASVRIAEGPDEDVALVGK